MSNKPDLLIREYFLDMKEEELLKAYYATLLKHCNGNITQAAEMAGVARKTFADRARRWGLIEN